MIVLRLARPQGPHAACSSHSLLQAHEYNVSGNSCTFRQARSYLLSLMASLSFDHYQIILPGDKDIRVSTTCLRLLRSSG